MTRLMASTNAESKVDTSSKTLRERKKKNDFCVSCFFSFFRGWSDFRQTTTIWCRTVLLGVPCLPRDPSLVRSIRPAYWLLPDLLRPVVWSFDSSVRGFNHTEAPWNTSVASATIGAERPNYLLLSVHICLNESDISPAMALFDVCVVQWRHRTAFQLLSVKEMNGVSLQFCGCSLLFYVALLVSPAVLSVYTWYSFICVGLLCCHHVKSCCTISGNCDAAGRCARRGGGSRMK